MIKFIFCFFILFANQFAYCQNENANKMQYYDFDKNGVVDSCFGDYSNIDREFVWVFGLNNKFISIRVEKNIGNSLHFCRGDY